MPDFNPIVVSQLIRMSSLLDPWAVRVAATLRLPDLIADGADTTKTLATRSGTNADALARLMRHLTILGLFSTTTDGRWEITELGALLRDDHPLGIRRGLDQNDCYVQKSDASVRGLLNSVRTGAAVWKALYGVSFWENITADPEFAESFNANMARYSAFFGPTLSRCYDWSNVEHVVDVGGGVGHTLVTILGAHRHLHGTLIDLPDAIADATAVLSESGVIDRCTLVPQSFFDLLPPGGSVYLLANVIHDWNDDDSIRILSRCAEAAGPTGRILLVERIIPENIDSGEQDLFGQIDLYMLLLVGGRERTVKQFDQLGAAAGLQRTAVYVLTDLPLSLIEYAVANAAYV